MSPASSCSGQSFALGASFLRRLYLCITARISERVLTDLNAVVQCPSVCVCVCVCMCMSTRVCGYNGVSRGL